MTFFKLAQYNVIVNNFSHLVIGYWLNLWLKSTMSFFMKTILLKCFPSSEEFTFNYVDCKQVADVINAMPSNKAPGIDKVPIRVLEDSLLITLPFITSIVNAYVCKTAEITPIPKQGNHELPNNNRPISPLPALSKVCERGAYNQFVIYLTTKKRLTTKQSVNKKWFSTEIFNSHKWCIFQRNWW